MTSDSIATAILELTKACNEHCPFCYSLSYSPRNADPSKSRLGVLSGDEWTQTLDNIAQAGTTAVDFSGGEPTLHPAFPRILAYAKAQGLYTIVSTNGSRVDDASTRDAIATAADCVALSIHGSTARSHDAVKGKAGAYDRAMQAYAWVAGMTPVHVKVNTVACQQNLTDIDTLGNLLGIERNRTVWKISQAIPREAGKLHKDLVAISDDAFNDLQVRIIAKCPRAYAEGRVVFREDDTATQQYSPYVIVRCDGEVFVPSGENHKSLGVNARTPGAFTALGSAIERILETPYERFADDLRSTHERSYRTP